MRELLWAALTLVAGVSMSPRLALADEQPVGVGPVEYAGEFPDYFQREIEQTLALAIEQAHAVAVELRVKSCRELECLREPATRAGVEVVIMPRVIKDDRDYRVELVAHAVVDGEVLARVEAECRVCGQRELLDALPAQVIELRAKIAEALAARTEPARLAVDGTPAGAKLSLDGDDLGVSPTALEVKPGKHELEILAPGYAAQIHRWVAAAGVEEVVSYELTPVNPAAGRGVWVGGWVIFSLGVALTGAGTTLAVLDGRNHGPTCSPELLDANGACPNVYTTATAGYVGLGVGLAAVGAGVGLLIHHRRSQSKRARVRVTAAGLRVRF